MKEVRAQVETVRPGRPLFVREWILGVNESHTPTATTAPPVDLQIPIVHGSCASERQFHYLLLSLEAKVQALARRTVIRCLLFDLVGCGASPVLTEYEAYSTENVVKDLQAVVETYLDPKVPIVWMGHSYGPNLILRLLTSEAHAATMSKYQTAGMILIGSAVRPVPDDPSFFPDGGLQLFYLPVWMLQCLQALLTAQFIKLAIHPKHSWLRKENTDWCNANSCFMIRSFYRQTVWSTMNDLVKVSSPSLPVFVIHGVDDGIVPLKYGQEMANAVPNGTFCPIDQASHLVMMEQADLVATKVINFLQQNVLK